MEKRTSLSFFCGVKGRGPFGEVAVLSGSRLTDRLGASRTGSRWRLESMTKLC